MNNSFVLIENHEPGIRVIKMNRPEVANALNSKMLQELKLALTDASENPDVRVVILTGQGEKAFIAGADITEIQNKNTTQGAEFSQLGHEVARLLDLMSKPTIAAVNGYALGGGTEMAIACDFILASDHAVFGQPEVGLGIIPGFGATVRLAKFVGLPRAKELIFTGKKINAQEAYDIGLVNHVYPLATFMDSVLDLAKMMSHQSQPAVSSAKKLLNEFSEVRGLNYKTDSEIQTFSRFFGSEDQMEGMKAFVEKRKPQFKGISS